MSMFVSMFVGVSFISAQAGVLVDLQLTQEEKAWLASHTTVRAGGPLAFPPFHYFDENGKANGIASEYFNRILDIIGIQAEIISDLPWPEVLAGAQSKDIDIITCAAQSEDRESYLAFSQPYLSYPMVIITRLDAPFISGLDDLHGRTIAFIRGVSTYDWVLSDKPSVNPYFVNTPLDALKAVSVGNADGYLGNLAASTYLIRKQGLANLKVAAPTTYGNYNLHFAVRKDWPELVSIIDKALDSISPVEKAAINNKWISIRYEYGIRIVDIIKWVLLVAGIAGLLIAVMIFINRRLKKEILSRKETERALKEAISEVKTLSGFLPICANCKKIRDDQGYWNQIEDYISRHSNAEFSHGICPECTAKLYGDVTDQSAGKKKA